MSNPAIAVIESPFQLLSLLEAMHGGTVAGEVDALVRGSPTAYRAIAGLIDRRATAPLTLRFGWSDGAVVRRAMTADELIVGDVLSGLAQLVLVLSRDGRVTLLDDGASILHAVATLADPTRSLVRPRIVPRRDRTQLARWAAATLRRRSEHGELVVSTGFDLGVCGFGFGELRRHEYSWTRSLAPTWWLPERADVLIGSALAADGLVHAQAYRGWLEESVRASTSAGRPVVFVPHRRESDAAVDVVRASSGLVGSMAGLPVEILAVAAPQGCAFSMLPSTVALTVGLVAPCVRSRVTTVPEHWWTDRAPQVARQFFNELATQAAASGRSGPRPEVPHVRQVTDGARLSPTARRAG